MRNAVFIVDSECTIVPNERSGPGGQCNPYAGSEMVVLGWKALCSETEHHEWWIGPGTVPDSQVLLGEVHRASTLSGDAAVILVGHNFNFDLHHIFKYWTASQVMEWVANWTIWDTMTVEYLLTGQRVQMAGLGDLERKYLPDRQRTVAKDEVHAMFKQGIGVDKMERELVDEYLKDDLAGPEAIFKAQFHQAVKLGMLPLIRQCMDAQIMAFVMEKEGLHVNTSLVPKIIEASEAELEEAQRKLVAALPLVFKGEVERMSDLTNHQLSRALVGDSFEVRYQVENGVYKGGMKKGQVKMSWVSTTISVRAPIPVNVRKLQRIKTNKDGTSKYPSASEKELDRIEKHLKAGQPWSALFDALLGMRKASKKYNTYAKGYLTKTCDDGRLRCELNQAVAATGRASCSNVNLQNLPSGL